MTNPAAAKLPPEIWTRIIALLYPRFPGSDRETLKPWGKDVSLAALATVSNLWQDTVEKMTFRKIHLSDARLGEASSILSQHRRVTFLKEIEVEIELSEALLTGEIEGDSALEEETMYQIHNLMFTEQVTKLFNLLDSLYKTVDTAAFDLGIKLRLHAHATNVQDRDSLRYNLHRLDEYGCKNGPYLTLDSLSGPLSSSLPTLNMVSVFHINDASRRVRYRRIHPRTCCEIASKLQGLKSINWNLSDNGNNRSEVRREFATNLSCLPSSLENFVLDYKYDIPVRSPSAGDILVLPDETDPLSTALSTLLQKLVTATLFACLSIQVLLPPAQKDGAPPQWPRLRKLDLVVSAFNPTGQWLIDKSLVPVHRRLIQPWVTVAGRAAAGMPSLRHFGFSTALATMEYYGMFDLSLQHGKLSINARPPYQLDVETEQLWMAVPLYGSQQTLEIVTFGS